MINILCFGDSNTHGYNSASGGRFSREKRWIGIVAKQLYPRAHIYEAGINGLSFGRDCLRGRPNRNAKTVYGAFLTANKPLDCIVVMLGTNDTKDRYNATPASIADDAHDLLCGILSHDQTLENKTSILLVSPVPMDKRAVSDPEMTLKSVACSRALAPALQASARELGVCFADAARWGVALAEDGCHFSEAGHRTFAACLTAELMQIPGLF